MLTEAGYLADPLTLAQRLMERLQVDLNDDFSSSPTEMYSFGDGSYNRQGPFSQPDHFNSGPIPQYRQRNGRQAFMSSSQPVSMGRSEMTDTEYSQLSEEPSMSQFTSNPHLPESLVYPSKL
jgi:hypothetical protein